jgi:amino acid permease
MKLSTGSFYPWASGHTAGKAYAAGYLFSACYKLSMLITLFVQAFKMGAEPFFFKQAEGQNPQKTYARVMKFFVIVVTTMFFAVSLFLTCMVIFIDENTGWD